jgi:hypothetical protein
MDQANEDSVKNEDNDEHEAWHEGHMEQSNVGNANVELSVDNDEEIDEIDNLFVKCMGIYNEMVKCYGDSLKSM